MSGFLDLPHRAGRRSAGECERYGRMYDAFLGRWFHMDPLAEKYSGISPFAYCVNNPVKFIDPDGRDIWEFDETGKIINYIETTGQDAFYGVKEADGEWQRTGQGLVFDHGTITGYRRPQITALSENGGREDRTLTIFEFREMTKLLNCLNLWQILELRQT